jgi:hypothetical protein
MMSQQNSVVLRYQRPRPRDEMVFWQPAKVSPALSNAGDVRRWFMWRWSFIALVSLCTPLLAQQMKIYERGVIINIQEDTQSSLYQGTSHTDYFENYWVRVGDTVYKGWCRDRLLHGCNIGFTIGDNVDVRFDKSSMFLRRSNGKEQKTTIEKRIKVTAQTSDALSDASSGLPSTPETQSEPAPPEKEQGSGGKVTIRSVPENAEITGLSPEFVGWIG